VLRKILLKTIFNFRKDIFSQSSVIVKKLIPPGPPRWHGSINRVRVLQNEAQLLPSNEHIRRMRSMKSEILDNQQLAERWHLHGTADAIAKRFQRLRALPKSNPRHLRALRIGNQIRYRLTDILEYEDRNVGKRRAILSVAV